MDPARLFEAVEAIYAAETELQSRGGLTWPPDLIGGPDEPAALRGFERDEIAAATSFLARLGLLRAVT
jgi:hypothetical protein